MKLFYVVVAWLQRKVTLSGAGFRAMAFISY